MMTDYRKKPSPSNFESQKFLMLNRAFWTHLDVQKNLSIHVSSSGCCLAQEFQLSIFQKCKVKLLIFVGLDLNILIILSQHITIK